MGTHDKLRLFCCSRITNGLAMGRYDVQINGVMLVMLDQRCTNRDWRCGILLTSCLSNFREKEFVLRWSVFSKVVTYPSRQVGLDGGGRAVVALTCHVLLHESDILQQLISKSETAGLMYFACLVCGHTEANWWGS